METKVNTLKQKALNAIGDSRDAMRSIGRPKIADPVGPRVLTHDNVKVIEADKDNFTFALERNKQQVVVILKGIWQLVYNGKVLRMSVSDARRIPESPFTPILKTGESGSKLVYIQFK